MKQFVVTVLLPASKLLKERPVTIKLFLSRSTFLLNPKISCCISL